MAKLRSPILGYNHNVRYRGLVFHVQTEDSGVTNPHVFTHLFHGGVILQTRKLVYDAGASEETVKALMQSQHKAVLKDLKRGTFDDKIDAYLGGTPGLLPRGQGVDGETAAAEAAPAPTSGPPPLAPPEDPVPVTVSFEPSSPTPIAIGEERTQRDSQPPPVSRTPTALPTAASIAIPPPGRTSARMPAINDTAEARAPTERFAPGGKGMPAQSMTPPPVTTREGRRDVSAAFTAIMVEESAAQIAGGGLVEVAEEESAPVEIHSPPPASAPLPGGERPGSYAQHRRRESGRHQVPPELSKPTPPPTPPPRTTSTTPVPARPTGPLSRPPTPMATARPGPAPTAPPARGGAAPPLPTYPSGRPASPAPPVGGRGTPQSRTRSPTGGGVVVTRPAVIIGAPARTVGSNTAAPPPAPPPPQAAAPAAPPKGSPSKVRKAREDSDAGIFGQDLISEKSLDEVILAYLSEDPNEE